MDGADFVQGPARSIGRLVIVVGLGGVACLLIAASVWASTARAATCDVDHACVWDQPNYDGSKDQVQIGTNECDYGCDWFPNFWANSAKNRLSGRAFKLKSANTGETKACLDPGEERPDPGRFNKVVFARFGQFCPF